MTSSVAAMTGGAVINQFGLGSPVIYHSGVVKKRANYVPVIIIRTEELYKTYPSH